MVKRCPSDPEGRAKYERELYAKLDRLIHRLPVALGVLVALIALTVCLK